MITQNKKTYYIWFSNLTSLDSIAKNAAQRKASIEATTEAQIEGVKDIRKKAAKKTNKNSKFK